MDGDIVVLVEIPEGSRSVLIDIGARVLVNGEGRYCLLSEVDIYYVEGHGINVGGIGNSDRRAVLAVGQGLPVGDIQAGNFLEVRGTFMSDIQTVGNRKGMGLTDTYGILYCIGLCLQEKRKTRQNIIILNNYLIEVRIEED